MAVLDAIVWDRSEVFFLGLYASSEDIAFYSLAFGLATRIMIIPAIAVGALLPAFSALHGHGDAEDFGRLYRSVLRYVALVGAPLAAMVAALAPSIIVWLYGDAYLPAAPLVGVLAAVALLSALRQVAWAALRGVGDRRCALTATAVAAVINVALAMALIPAGARSAPCRQRRRPGHRDDVGVRRHGLHAPRALPGSTSARPSSPGCWRGSSPGSWRVMPTTCCACCWRAPGAVVAFLLACVACGLLGTREWALLTSSTRRFSRCAPRRHRALRQEQ